MRNLGEARRLHHGVGYIISVRPFVAGDSRVAVLRGNTVWINSNHPDYQAFQNSKICRSGPKIERPEK